MKRKKLKYKDYINIENIIYIYKLIRKNIKNKKKIEQFENYFSINIYRIYNTLLNNNYKINIRLKKFKVFI